MKFSTITISALSIIASAHARRRRLNTIVGNESDESMSMLASSLYAAKGGGGSKSSKAPSPAPPPEVCLCLCSVVEQWRIKLINFSNSVHMATAW